MLNLNCKVRATFLVSPKTGANVTNQVVMIQQESPSKILYTFQSYNSIVAIYESESKTLALGCDWDFSTTTLKYLYQFLSNININGCNKKAIEKAIKTGFIENNRGDLCKVIYCETLK